METGTKRRAAGAARRPAGKTSDGSVPDGGASGGKAVTVKPATVKPAAGKTRTRILLACRDLFNERGPAGVTTAEIAAAVRINEGNLHYHFQRKEQILEALFALFEDALRDAARAHRDCGPDPGGYRAYLLGWFRVMWAWRFFYRDGAMVFRLAPDLRPRLKLISDEGHAETGLAIAGMRRAGLIAIAPEAIDALVVNAWICSTYWLDYLRSRRGVAEVRREHVDWGAAQVTSLFRPYLTRAGRTFLDAQPAAAGGDPGAGPSAAGAQGAYSADGDTP